MKRNFMFLTTFLIQVIIAAEMAIIGPLSPFLALYFSIDQSMVILLSLGYSAVGFLVPYLGVFGDKYGKKKSISISLFLFTLGSIVGSVSKSPYIFGFARIFIGFAYFSLSATNLSYLSEFISYKNRGKASGVLRVAFSMSILFSPVIATYLVDRYNNLAVIYIPLAIISLVVLGFLRQLPETTIDPSITVNKKEFLSLLSNPTSRKILISVFLILTSPTLILNYLGIYLSNSFNVSQVSIGTIYTIGALGTVLGTFFSGVFSDGIGKYKLSKILFIIMLIAIVPLPYMTNLAMIVLLLVLFSFGMDGGWTSYQAFASEIVPEKRGTFMSLLYTVNAITITFYSLVGPFLYTFGGFPFLITIASITSAIAIYILLTLKIKEEVIQKASN